MKAIPHYLVCYTAWGSISFRGEYHSRSDAVKTGRKMVSDRYAHSYRIKPLNLSKSQKVTPMGSGAKERIKKER